MERAEANLKIPTSPGFYWCVNQFGIKEIVEITLMMGADKKLYILGDFPVFVEEYPARIWGPRICDWNP